MTYISKNDRLKHRKAKIRVLLLLLNEPYKALLSKSAETPAGFFTRDYKSCDDCDLNGFVSRHCTNCGGTNRIPLTGKERADPYLQPRILEGPSKGTGASVMDSYQMDNEITRLRRSEAERRGDNPGGLERWEVLVQRAHRKGNFSQLLRIMNDLRVERPDLQGRWLTERAVSEIESRWRGRIRVPDLSEVLV